MADFAAAEPAAAPCFTGWPALADRTRPTPAITATAAAHTATVTVRAVRSPRRRPPGPAAILGRRRSARPCRDGHMSLNLVSHVRSPAPLARDPVLHSPR